MASGKRKRESCEVVFCVKRFVAASRQSKIQMEEICRGMARTLVSALQPISVQRICSQNTEQREKNTSGTVCFTTGQATESSGF